VEWWGHAGMFGGALWTPSQISTALWLDAADVATITTISGAVSQWNDKSSNNNNLIQTTAGARPPYIQAAFNGLNIVRLNKSATLFKTNATGLPSGSASPNGWSWFYVRSQMTNSAFAELFGWGQNTVTGSRFGCWVDASNRSGIETLGSARVGNIIVTASSAVISGVYPGGANSTYSQWNNGSPETMSGTLTTAAVASPAAELRVSGIPGAGDYTGYYVACDLGEIIIVPSAVASNVRERIEGYLGHKWGLASLLPAGHPYKTSAPTI
jgi:hypothetical protein